MAIRETFNGMYNPAPDDKISKGTEIWVDIFTILPQSMSNFVNIGVLCVGRYEIIPTKDSTVSEAITAELASIVKSIAWSSPDLEELPAEISHNANISNLIFVANNHQYFVDKKKVLRRSDKYNFAVRNKVVKKGDMEGMLVSDSPPIAHFDNGFDKTFTKLDKLTDWYFPSVTWKEVHGVSPPNAKGKYNYIKKVNADKIMVLDVFRTQVGVYNNDSSSPDSYYPIYVKKNNGEQINYVSQSNWSIVPEGIFHSKQDTHEVSLKYLTVVFNQSGAFNIVSEHQLADVTVRSDYWNGEILRAKFYEHGSLRGVPKFGGLEKIEIDQDIPSLGKVHSMHVCRPELVNRPTVITVFKKDRTATKFVSDVHDIVINKNENGIIKEFTMTNKVTKANETPSDYWFALVGDYADFRTMGNSSLDKVDLKEREDTKEKNVVVDELCVDDGIVFKSGTSVDIAGVGTRMIIKIIARKFDKNLSPLLVEIETDLTSIIYEYGKTAKAIRFIVPDDKRLAEIEAESKNVSKLLEKKAEGFSKKIEIWLSGDGKAIKEFAKGKDKVSGLTLINMEDLAEHDKELVIEGVA